MRYDFMRQSSNHITGPVIVSVDGQLVARFENTAGDGNAFAAFVRGVRETGGSVYDADRRQYIVGSIDQLMGVAS
jgi:predicted regulator of Ras-like GTPase activity (Roadblock/LC7/MglB family)